MGATPTANTSSIPTGHDTSNPIGLLAVTRTAPAIRPRVETPPSHRQSRSEQRNERNPSHVVMSDAANNNPKPPDSHNRSPTSGGHITWMIRPGSRGDSFHWIPTMGWLACWAA